MAAGVTVIGFTLERLDIFWNPERSWLVENKLQFICDVSSNRQSNYKIECKSFFVQKKESEKNEEKESLYDCRPRISNTGNEALNLDQVQLS